MSNSTAVTGTPRASRAAFQQLVHVAFTGGVAFALVFSSPAIASAQARAEQQQSWELRFTSGALVPTGDQRNVIGNAQLSAAQLSWVVRPSVAVTGTFGWARSRDVASATKPKLDVFTSDVGVEARPAQWHAKRAVSFSPFVGLGAGARSYNYRKLDVDATHNVAGYGAVGGELGMGRVGLRLELRDYVSGFRPLRDGGRSVTRNDVVVMAGLRFDRKRANETQASTSK